MDVDVLFNVPSFVKEASSDSFAIDAPDAVIVGGYRFDNPAAAWMSAASIRKQAMEDPSFSPEHAILSMMKKACDLFEITEDCFQLNPFSSDVVMVKTASEGAEFIITDEKSFNDTVAALLQKRASASYELCKDCAKELIKIATKHDYQVSDDNKRRLCKMAGAGHVDFQRGAAEIEKRVAYANKIGQHDAAALLEKYANICKTASDESIVPLVIEGIDEFDRGVNILNKVASEKMNYPEDSFYMDTDEYLAKKASEELKIDAKRSIKRLPLMKQANVDAISSWAGDFGFKIASDATPEEVVSVVKTMPASLREEFVKTLK